MAKALEDPETEELLRKASGSGGPALQLLLDRHRSRLRRMVAVRLDSRLAPLTDPSDVVQEALAGASHKLEGYLRDRPLPFYPWLRRLAWERGRGGINLVQGGRRPEFRRKGCVGSSLVVLLWPRVE